MSSRNVHIDRAHRRITQQIILERLALDGDSCDGTLRPEKSAHHPTPGLCRIYPLVVNDQDRSAVLCLFIAFRHRWPTQTRIFVRDLRPDNPRKAGAIPALKSRAPYPKLPYARAA